MTPDDGAKTGDPSETAPVIDLLKRHATIPSRQLVLSEAFESARRLQSEPLAPKTPSDSDDLESGE